MLSYPLQIDCAPYGGNYLQSKEAEKRLVEFRGFPCLKIQTWGTHHLCSDLRHPPMSGRGFRERSPEVST
jgi:hypothetical protein